MLLLYCGESLEAASTGKKKICENHNLFITFMFVCLSEGFLKKQILIKLFFSLGFPVSYLCSLAGSNSDSLF